MNNRISCYGCQVRNDEIENYRLALAWIQGQSTDPKSRELATVALNCGEHVANSERDHARDLLVLETLLSSTCFGEDVCQFPPCRCAASIADALGKP